MNTAIQSESTRAASAAAKPSNARIDSRRIAATPRGVGVMCRSTPSARENAELWDVEGRRYIDFAGGIAVLNTGHRHPR